MKIADGWQDYEIIATGGGMKLERWKDIILLRPDPQVIWDAPFELESYPALNAVYRRSSSGGGFWDIKKPFPEEWTMRYKHLEFLVKPMGFKHTGLFPEQAVHWDKTAELIKNSNRKIRVLNLFAYTGGATVACAAAGAEVCHVDAAKNMVERAKQNIELNGIGRDKTRFIIDDCKKFVEREKRRGKVYDAVIMDPPSYGKGPLGEMWKLEDELFGLTKQCAEILSTSPCFFLINSYTTGLSPIVLKNILSIVLKGGKTEAYEVALPSNDGVLLPCGAGGICVYE